MIVASTVCFVWDAKSKFSTKKDHGYPGAMVKDGKDLEFSSYCCPRKGVEETINMLEQYLYVGWIICKKTHGPKAPGNGIKNVKSKLSLGHKAQPNSNPHSKSVHGRGILWPMIRANCGRTNGYPKPCGKYNRRTRESNT